MTRVCPSSEWLDVVITTLVSPKVPHCLEGRFVVAGHVVGVRVPLSQIPGERLPERQEPETRRPKDAQAVPVPIENLNVSKAQP